MRYLLKDDHQDLRARRDISEIGERRFEGCLSKAEWDALPRAVQIRFSRKIAPGEACVYRGQIERTDMSFPGRILAQVLRIIGAPLPLDPGNSGAAAVVSITDDAAGNGQFWVRQYGRPKGFPQVLHSTKRFAGPTGLEEYIGAGIGLTLRLREENGALWFDSDRYYLGGMKRRIYIPKAFCPGALRVGHEDLGSGRFLFTLSLHHKLFGRLLHQTIIFKDPEITR